MFIIPRRCSIIFMCAITGDMSVDHDTGRSNDIPEEGFMCIMSAIPVGWDRDQTRMARYTYTVHRWQSPDRTPGRDHQRSEEHTSELTSLMRNSYSDYVHKTQKH